MVKRYQAHAAADDGPRVHAGIPSTNRDYLGRRFAAVVPVFGASFASRHAALPSTPVFFVALAWVTMKSARVAAVRTAAAAALLCMACNADRAAQSMDVSNSDSFDSLPSEPGPGPDGDAGSDIGDSRDPVDEADGDTRQPDDVEEPELPDARDETGDIEIERGCPSPGWGEECQDCRASSLPRVGLSSVDWDEAAHPEVELRVRDDIEYWELRWFDEWSGPRPDPAVTSGERCAADADLDMCTERYERALRNGECVACEGVLGSWGWALVWRAEDDFHVTKDGDALLGVLGAIDTAWEAALWVSTAGRGRPVAVGARDGGFELVTTYLIEGCAPVSRGEGRVVVQPDGGIEEIERIVVDVDCGSCI